MILDEIIQAIKTAWDSAMTGYSLYYSHGPQSNANSTVAYPFVVFNIIDSPKTYAMRSSGTASTDNHTYSKVRVQFTVWCNEEQFAEGIEISNTIETTYQFSQLSCDETTNMGNYIGNQNIQYFNQDKQKVYSLNTDIIFYVGI